MEKKLDVLIELNQTLGRFSRAGGILSRPDRRRMERHRSALIKMRNDKDCGAIATRFLTILDEMKALYKADNDEARLAHALIIAQKTHEAADLAEELKQRYVA